MSIYPWQQLQAFHKHVDMIKYDMIAFSRKIQYFILQRNFNLHGTRAAPAISDWALPCSVEELQSENASRKKKLNAFDF